MLLLLSFPCGVTVAPSVSAARLQLLTVWCLVISRAVQALAELAAVAQGLEQKPPNFFYKGPDKYLGLAG